MSDSECSPLMQQLYRPDGKTLSLEVNYCADGSKMLTRYDKNGQQEFQTRIDAKGKIIQQTKR
jgi:hypothetical protein